MDFCAHARGLVVQLGYDVAFTRRRSGVRIPAGPCDLRASPRGEALPARAGLYLPNSSELAATDALLKAMAPAASIGNTE